MTDAISDSFSPPANAGSFRRRLIAAAALIPAADYLLFQQQIGLSLALFALLVAVGAVAASGPRALSAGSAGAVCFLLATIAPLVDGIGPLSILFSVGGMILFSLAIRDRLARPGRTAADIIQFAATGIVWFCLDLVTVLTVSRKRKRARLRSSSHLLAWIMPAVLCGTFLCLFSSANPVIEDWLRVLDLQSLFSRIDFPRVLFWVCAGPVVWPFIRPRVHRTIASMPAPTVQTPSQPFVSEAWRAVLFGPPAILRSLALFNALFAVQSLLDLIYLWHGAALPDHLSYAAYAHRGAYPLILTALLAGGFLIAATQDGSTASQSRAIRFLIHLWTAQNLLLVASSILRLDLYVATYSLTYLRFAAFIWMLLTATGLVLILVRMSLDKSNAWLIASNFAALVSVLYVSTFVNFPGVISSYNVRHSLEISGSGTALDIGYLQTLGPRSLPALDRYILRMPIRVSSGAVKLACQVRNNLVARYGAEEHGWRGWSAARWQLDGYLTGEDAHEASRNCGQTP